MGASKPKNTHGANPKTFPRSVADYVDWDYADKLNQEELEWLAWFGDCYYAADFRGDPEGVWSTEERRERYRYKNTANRNEVYGAIPASALVHPEDFDYASGFCDWQPTPEHLNSPEYKAAVAAIRDAKPGTPKHLRAKRRLEKIIGKAPTLETTQQPTLYPGRVRTFAREERGPSNRRGSRVRADPKGLGDDSPED